MIRLHPIVERTLIVIFLAGAVPADWPGWCCSLDAMPRRRRTGRSRRGRDCRGTRQSLRALPEQLTRYFEDHFAFRQRLVRWQAIARLRALRRLTVRRRDQGARRLAVLRRRRRDGGLRGSAAVHRRRARSCGARTLQDTSDWLRAQGIAYVFVISPDKHVIYPEYMPATIRRAAVSRIDQLVVAPARALHRARARPAAGAARGQGAASASTTAPTHTGTTAAPSSATSRSSMPLPRTSRRCRGLHAARSSHASCDPQGLDLAGMLGLTSVLDEDDLVLVPRRPATARILEPQHPNPRLMHARIVTEAPNRGPRAVVFMDSFGAGLVPFLSEDFSRVVYLWQNNMDPQIVQQERPQVVIQEWVGRRLATLLPYNPVPDMSARSGGP